jgi:hypothetical protein
MHLFERTVFMPLVDEILLPRINMIFAMKEKNDGKFDAHAWFFEAFAEHLKPKYCIMMETAISRLMCSMDRDPKIAGVCGELTMYRAKIPNILDRSTGSVFSSIKTKESVNTKEHPLTGEPEGPLVRYFQTLTTPMGRIWCFGPFQGNMHLVKDRILCFEIVARLNERWTMHYCKGAVAKTDVPETIEGLVRQRCHWLNGAFFVAVYSVTSFPRVVNDTVHSTVRKFFLFFCEFVFIATVLTVTWMLLSNVYLTFYFIRKGGFHNNFGDSGDEKGGENALLFTSLMYLSFFMVQFVIGLGIRPEDVRLFHRVSVCYFGGALMSFTLILCMSPLFSLEIWPTRDENYCDATKEHVAKEVEGADKKTEVQGKRGVPSASTVSARNYGPSKAILMKGGCTGTGVSISKASEVFESSEYWGMAFSPTSDGVVANVPCRRDGSVGPINNVKGRGVMNAEIEHLVHIISGFVFLLRISFFIIGCAMGANAIHSTLVKVPEVLLLIGLTLTAKRKRMLTTNLEGVETIGYTSCTCSEMGTLTQNKFMKGTATLTCTNIFALCVAVSPSCMQTVIDIYLFVLNSKHGRSDVTV